MVATDGNRDNTAAPQYNSHSGPHDTFREHFVEHSEGSGEGALRVPALGAPQSSKQNGDVRRSKITSQSFHGTTWLAGGQIPPEEIATSLPLSPPNKNCHTSPNLKEKKNTMSEDIEQSMNEHQGAHSNSKQTLARRSSSNMSLDTSPAIYKDADNAILYRRPQSPFIDPSLYVRSIEKPGGLSNVELRRLLKLRRRVQTIRLQIHAQRAQVDAKRDAQSDADERYIREIRTNHVTKDPAGITDPSEVLILQNLWRLCQTARDEYGPAADALISLEYRLEVEEAKLERIEERIYKQWDMKLVESQIISPLPREDQIDDESQDEDYESTSQSSQESRHTGDVGYNDYLRRLGNLDLLQERYQSLLNEKAMLEEERTKRLRVGRDLDSENMDFLARFEHIIKPVSIDIKEVSEDVTRLKQLCLEKGLIDGDGNPVQDSATVVEESPAASGEGAQFEHPAEHCKPSQHQEPSGNNEPDSSVSLCDGGLSRFINLWLLQKLRSSPIEVLIFSHYVAARVDNMDGLKWQAEALRLWEQDGAGMTTLENVERLESYVISSIRRSFEGGEQYPGERKVSPSNSAVKRISFPIRFHSRPRAKSAL